MFRGSKLQYTAIAYGKLLQRSDAIVLPNELALQARVIATDSGISVAVSWEGKPLPHTKVNLYDAKTESGIESETDDAGQVAFSKQQVQAGLNAIRVGHKIAKAGKLDDATYNGETYYLTATFVNPEQPAVDNFGALPFAITSFGAATDGKALYVFGGHMGDAHSYSFEEQSDKLLRLNLTSDKHAWEEIATGNRVQGTALVAYQNELIVVGGFQARNKKGENKDLHSLADVRSFNTQTQKWTELPALPEPRSSHDAALIGSSIYVVGGWQLNGEADAHWHKTSWKMDLQKSQRKWEAIAAPPFERRALAAIEHQGKLVVVGGMDYEGGPTRSVALYDPQTDKWSALPDITGDKAMAGFGAAGWSMSGKLVITTQEGKIEELIDDKSWKVIGETKDARFFHRILPVGNGRLVAIGGANMSSGKFTDTEVIHVRQ